MPRSTALYIVDGTCNFELRGLQYFDVIALLIPATICSYEVRSPKRIALVFDEARVGDLRISQGLEALIAPAILPRTSLQHMLLLALKQVRC